MKMSHPVYHNNGSLQIPDRVREWLQLPRQCRLHGRLVDDANDPALVLSPIPHEHWDRCYRLTINTSHEHGSLATVMGAIADRKLTVLYQLASAVSAHGELCLSAVIAPTSNDQDAAEHPDIYSAKLESDLRNDPKLQQYLSKADWFDTQGCTRTHLRTIRVVPLLLLRALKRSIPHRDRLGKRIGSTYSSMFSLDVKDSTISLRACDLDVIREYENPPGRISVFDCMTSYTNTGSHSMQITADAHECHLRLCMLPPRPFVVVSVDVAANASSMDGLCGIGRRIAEALAEAPNAMNIYHASSFVITSDGPDINNAVSETMKYRLIGDMSHTSKPTSKSTEQSINDAIKSRLSLLPTAPSVTAVARVRPLHAPLVFVATNVKDRVEKKYLKLGIELCRSLRENYLNPVFLDTLEGTPIARTQMTRLLDACPILVSYFVPEPDLILKHSSSTNPIYAAPSWPLFEEAYQSSKPNRRVYRLIHDSVYSPPHIDRVVSLSFNTKMQFRERLRHLSERIIADRSKDNWPIVLQECTRSESESGIGSREFVQHDPEKWMTEILNRHSDPQ